MERLTKHIMIYAITPPLGEWHVDAILDGARAPHHGKPWARFVKSFLSTRKRQNAAAVDRQSLADLVLATRHDVEPEQAIHPKVQLATLAPQIDLCRIEDSHSCSDDFWSMMGTRIVLSPETERVISAARDGASGSWASEAEIRAFCRKHANSPALLLVV